MIKGALLGISTAFGILIVYVIGVSLDGVYPGLGGGVALVLALGAFGAALGFQNNK